MALQLSVAIRNARLDSLEAVIGTAPKLQIRSSTPPVNCAAADNGVLLAEIDLPSDWMTAAVSGSKSKSGIWTTTAFMAGIAGHFRIKDTTGVTTHVQGTVTLTSGSGDMTVDNTNIAFGQTVTVVAFTLIDANS